MDRTGCHPVLSNDDFDKYEQQQWRLDEPISVKLVSKKSNTDEAPKSSKPIIGNIVERKPRAPVAPGAPPKSNSMPKDNETNPANPSIPLKESNSQTSDIHRDIDCENVQRIAQMNPDEIAEDLDWIKSNLSEQAIAFLKSRNDKK